jgi:endonuclease VIII
VPEGDTILRTARSLDRALAGRAVERFEAPRLVGLRPSPGARVSGVEAVGKHLFVNFEDGRSLHTHMRMNGSWHLYRPGAPWRKSASAARVVIEVEGAVAVCFSAPVVEMIDASGRARHQDVLGPDLCRQDADLDEALRRIDRLVPPGTTVAEVLLDQRVAAGVGNVYKSEVLFACRVDPFTPVGRLDAAARRSLLETASAQLRANLDGWHRSTVAGGGLAVYGRTGRPCRRCRTPIRSRRHGAQARTTYWCPTCQPSPEENVSESLA